MIQVTDKQLKPSLALFEPAPSITLDAVFKMKFASVKGYNVCLKCLRSEFLFHGNIDIWVPKIRKYMKNLLEKC